MLVQNPQYILDKLCSVYFKNFGCKVNISESNTLKDELSEYVRFTEIVEDANVVIVNSCCVTEIAVNKCLHFIKNLKHKNADAKVLVIGCLADHMGIKLSEHGVNAIITNDNKKSVVSILKKMGIIEKKHLFTSDNDHSSTRAFLKIQEGCDNYCSYCIIPYVRGKPKSKGIDDVLIEFNELIEKGYKEIVLVGIHLGKYGIDRSINLYQLLQKLIAINKDFRVRLSSIEINEISKEIVKLMQENSDKICPHLHIPLQSGSDRILTLMNRNYKRYDFIEKIDYIKSSIPAITIGFDVIVGFPSENKQDFLGTKEIITSARPNYVHIFPYSDRPGTKAYEIIDKVDNIEKQDRIEELNAIHRIFKIDSYRNKINSFCRVLIEKDFTGYSDDYFKVKVDFDEINVFANVKIISFEEENMILGGKICTEKMLR
mgnify:CR=1 FL=1